MNDKKEASEAALAMAREWRMPSGSCATRRSSRTGGHRSLWAAKKWAELHIEPLVVKVPR